MIDIVGHFGSRLSYATVSHQVADGLFGRGLLGNITNLDDQFLDDKLAGRPHKQRSRRVILIADPRDYLTEAMVAEYGRDNVAIFVCPNTNQLSAERVRSCVSAGRIYTPSNWCRRTILHAMPAQGDMASKLADVEVMPLGVDEPFANGWTDHDDRTPGEPLRVLHVTTDTFWPGRKGTEELLRAWPWRTPGVRHPAKLTVHCLPQLYGMVHQELGALDLLDVVKLLAAPLRGSTPQELCELIASHDLLVAPSRSEGFGMIPLAALVSGTPVLTTADTGQDYLAERGDDGTPVLGGWMQIPTMGADELVGEDGVAPSVRFDQLAHTLKAGCHLYDDLLADVGRNARVQTEWSWWARRNEWARSLAEWEES